jgi:ParB/RepB/Spo0J family partition protein
MRASKKTASPATPTKAPKAKPLKIRSDARAFIAPIDSIKPWARNPRRNEEAVDAVALSITTFDFNDPIIVCRETNEIVAGHARYKAAKRLGLTEVPIRFTDLTPERAYAYAIAANKTGEIAKWDADILPALLTEIRTQDAELIKALGYSEKELTKLVAVAGHMREAPTPFEYKEQFAVMVVCSDEAEQKSIYERLTGEGFTCKVVVV